MTRPINNDAAPALGASEVTPSDSVDLSAVAKALWVGSFGDVRLVTHDGATVTFENVPSGTVLPVSCNRVLATGTTATGIVALLQ